MTSSPLGSQLRLGEETAARDLWVIHVYCRHVTDHEMELFFAVLLVNYLQQSLEVSKAGVPHKLAEQKKMHSISHFDVIGTESSVLS
jgi:hypothetical protein